MAKSVTNPEQAETAHASVDDASQAEDVSQTVESELDELDASLSDMTSMLLDDTDDDDFDFGGGFDDPLDGTGDSAQSAPVAAQEDNPAKPPLAGEEPLEASTAQGEEDDASVEPEEVTEPAAESADDAQNGDEAAQADCARADDEAEAVTDAMQAAAQALEEAQEDGEGQASAQTPIAEASAQHDEPAGIEPEEAPSDDATQADTQVDESTEDHEETEPMAAEPAAAVDDEAASDEVIAENETGDVDTGNAEATQDEAAEAMQAAAQMVEEPSHQSDAISQASGDTPAEETQTATQAQASVGAHTPGQDASNDEQHDERVDGGADVPADTTADAGAADHQAEQAVAATVEKAKAAKKRSFVGVVGEKAGPVLRRMGMMAGPILGKGASVLALAMEPVAERFAAQPKVVRQSISWLALVTAFNAVALWSFLLFFRSPERGIDPSQGSRIIVSDGSAGTATNAGVGDGAIEPGSAAHAAVSHTANVGKTAGKP